jgi:ABC-type hemin transport system ATPase subunit
LQQTNNLVIFNLLELNVMRADRAYVLSRGAVAINKKAGESLSDTELERVFLA